MIVEDNTKVRVFIKKMLQSNVQNIDDIFECSDGDIAIEMHRKVKPDWILMDIKLPTIDGLETTKRILREFPATKVLIVTQYNENIYHEMAKNLGAVGYILKENLTEIPNFINTFSIKINH